MAGGEVIFAAVGILQIVIDVSVPERLYKGIRERQSVDSYVVIQT